MTTFAPRGILDVERLRGEFPILKRLVRGKPLTYLDSGATSLKPRCVIDAVNRYYSEGTANIHRGVHMLSEEATSLFEATRATVQTFINAKDQSEIVFTTGTTGGINLVAKSFVTPRVQPGDEILITTLEHHGNIVPWQMVRDQTQCKLVVVPIRDDGALNMDEFKRMIGPKTRFISCTWISNALGVINPIREIIALAKAAQVPILIDAAQAVAHVPIDVQALDVDFLVFSGHKLFAPTGVGVLYGKKEHLDSMPPLFGGGDMIKTVTFEKTVYADPPARFEAGTPDIASVIGLGEAIRFVKEDVGFAAIQAHEHQILNVASAALKEVIHMRIMGTAEPKVPIFSMVFNGIHAHDVGTILDHHGIAVRTGHHCAQPLLARLGVASTTRASFSIYNRVDDVDVLVRALWKTQELFA